MQKGKPISADDEFLLQWAKESKKANIALANDVLGKLLTISTTVVGGGVIFLNKSIISTYLIGPILILFLSTLILALLGVLPYQAAVDLSSPTEIENHKSKALKNKLKYIKISSFCFIFGLLLAIGGVVYKQLCT